ncbi:hypothetical protein GCM10023169_24660 [Georgenia halophila]|uniref:Uncharacterized protein n=1 Tax=Georgenia halophila TaxID=620889 RepID=A0ABP8LD48_9MICO
MSWSRRRTRAVIALLVGGIAMLAGAALLGGGSIRACPAIGYADISSIELEFDPSLGVNAVAACLGTDCQPVALTGAGGKWSVPQSAEYLQSTEPGSVTQVKVEASSEGDVVVEKVFEVARERDDGTWWQPECPGPYHYLPVSIGP